MCRLNAELWTVHRFVLTVCVRAWALKNDPLGNSTDSLIVNVWEWDFESSKLSHYMQIRASELSSAFIKFPIWWSSHFFSTRRRTQALDQHTHKMSWTYHAMLPPSLGTVPSFGGTFPNLGNLAAPLLYPGSGVPSLPAVSSAPMQCYFLGEEQAQQNGRHKQKDAETACTSNQLYISHPLLRKSTIWEISKYCKLWSARWFPGPNFLPNIARNI